MSWIASAAERLRWANARLILTVAGILATSPLLAQDNAPIAEPAAPPPAVAAPGNDVAAPPTNAGANPVPLPPDAQNVQPRKAAPAPAAAPKRAPIVYKQDLSKFNKVDLSRLRNTANGILRGDSLSGREAEFTTFWNEGFFANMTQLDNLPSLGKDRDNFRRMQRQSTNQAAHDLLNEIALKRLTGIAAGTYHPFVRYHAILLIGDLNEREGASSEDAGIPYKPSFSRLLVALSHPSLPDSLKVAAFRGIERHVRSGGVAANDLATVRDASRKLLTDPKPAARGDEAHDWLRTRAAEMLGLLRDPGQNGAVVSALAAVLGEETASLGLRVSAAEALGNMNLAAAGKQDPAELVRKLGMLAVAVYRYEIVNSGQEGATMSAGRLLHRLRGVQQGLFGPDTAQPAGVSTIAQDPAQKQMVQGISNSLVAMMRASEKEPISDANAAEIRKAGDALAALVGAEPEAPQPQKRAAPARAATARKGPESTKGRPSPMASPVQAGLTK